MIVEQKLCTFDKSNPKRHLEAMLLSHEKLHFRLDTTEAPEIGRSDTLIQSATAILAEASRLLVAWGIRPPLDNRPVGGILHWSPETTLVVAIAVVSVTVVVVLQEEVLICAVAGESDSRDTEAGEEALEAVEAAEGTVVAPGLTMNSVRIQQNSLENSSQLTYLRAHGSRLAQLEDGEAAALNWPISKPVGLRAGIVRDVSVNATRRAKRESYQGL